MYKKILAICLSVVIAMSTAIVPVFADSFNLVIGNDESTSVTSIARADKKDKDKSNDKDDVEDILKLFLDSKDIKWAEKAIEKLGAMGILNGVGNGFFKPSNNVTHVEAIAMVIKLLGQKEEADAIDDEPEYFENQCDEWSYGYLQLALDNGIIIPEEDGKFNPKTPAKRHEVAKYIVRALDMRDEALANMSASLSFNDSSSIPKNSVGYVYVISKLGIMQGNNNNEFQPNKPITRAEMAVLLDRAEGKFDDTFDNDNEFDGIFLSYDSTNSSITMKVNNKEVVYNVIPNAPVYKNNTYYTLSVLQPGDLIEIVLDSSNRIIFIEFKEVGTVPPSTGEKLSFRHMEYSALSAELKDLIDNLKQTENYVAYKQGQYIYLITSKGQMASGGYTISVKEVYRETVQNGKYNLRAVVETTSPTSSMITQAVTFPYDVVRLSYFNGIDKVNFVEPDNDLIEQTSLVSVNDFEVITGKITSIDTANRIIYFNDANNTARAYYISTNAQITLNNSAAALSALAANMPVTVTVNNGYAIRIAAQSTDAINTVSGTITSVDTVNKILYLKDVNNISRAYYIASNAVVTLNNSTVALSSLTANMPVTVTLTNGYATRISAQNANSVQVINGTINSVDTSNRILYLKDTNNTSRAYYLPSNAEITLNNTAVAITSLTANMPVAVTLTNNIVTKVAAQNADRIVTINGKIVSVDIANRIIYVKESDNVT
ncbi:MAG: S-layer y domain protein, partial [Clostridia bacterium]|nr:S-layer y domain protein [Clostridia bacterium]